MRQASKKNAARSAMNGQSRAAHKPGIVLLLVEALKLKSQLQVSCHTL